MPMPPILSVVGKSDSGKTTLLEKLLPELTRRGYKVATLKHHHQGNIDIDRPGKDSYRHRQAGANATIVVSPTEYVLMQSVPALPSVDELVAKLDPVDLVITEGWKRGDKPKLEVYRPAVHPEPLCGPEDNCFAVALEGYPAGADRFTAPVFDWNDARGLADLIEARFLRNSR